MREKEIDWEYAFIIDKLIFRNWARQPLYPILNSINWEFLTDLIKN
jgi:hypothetical protein